MPCTAKWSRNAQGPRAEHGGLYRGSWTIVHWVYDCCDDACCLVGGGDAQGEDGNQGQCGQCSPNGQVSSGISSAGQPAEDRCHESSSNCGKNERGSYASDQSAP